MTRYFDAFLRSSAPNLRFARTVLSAVGAAAALQFGGVAQAASLPGFHIVQADIGGDVNGDKIDARLEAAVTASDYISLPSAVMRGQSAAAVNKGITGNGTVVDIIVCIDHPPTTADINALKSSGFTVKDVYSHAIYGLHVTGPLTNGVQTLHNLVAGIKGVSYIGANYPVHPTLIHSTRQIGARQAWPIYENLNQGLPLRGDPGRSIAIVDTGLDSSHTDLGTFDSNYASGQKVIGWFDSTSLSPVPFDPEGHGSHVSGIAAGTGVAGGISSGTGFLPMTINPDEGPDVPVNATGFTSSPTLSVDAFFGQDLLGVDNTVLLGDSSDLGPTGNILAQNSSSSGTAPIPLSFAVPLTTTVASGANSTTIPTNFDYYLNFTTDSIPDPFDFIATVRTPQTATGDGFNLVTGVAPESSLVGVRVFNNSIQSGSESAIIGALDFISANQNRYNIGVANMSLGGDFPDPIADTAVANVVAQGIVCVIAAGNDRGNFEDIPDLAYSGGIGSPGSASAAITVAAVGPQNEIAVYSSYGVSAPVTYTIPADDGGGSFTLPAQTKPDVSAPGGSFTLGNPLYEVNGVATHDETIQSVDSNDNDAFLDGQTDQDLQTNDYTNMQGTSMATPHVTGSVALLEQAMNIPGALQGAPKSGGDEAYFIKALLEMTSTGTEQNADILSGATTNGPNPPTLIAPAAGGTPTGPHHTGRDLVEGFGKINVDAAISAILQTYIVGATATDTFGSGPMTKQAWARNVSLTATVPYTFTLTQPAAVTTGTTTVTPEYDLLLYSEAYTQNSGISNGSIGDPTLVANSELTTGATQTFTYTPTTSGIYFIVVTRVTGTGAFSLTSSGGTATVNSLAVTVTDSSSGNKIENALVLAKAANGTVLNSAGTGANGVATLSIPSGQLSRISVTAAGHSTGTSSLTASATTASIALNSSHVFSPGVQMITLPSTTATSIQGSTWPLIFVDAIWTPNNQEYVLPPTAIADNFTPGAAYWVRLRQQTTLTVVPSPPSSGSFNISLSSGWNMVGSPYLTPGDLSAATIAIGSISQSLPSSVSAGLVSGLYSFNPSAGAYNAPITTGSLVAYQGYWIFANQACTLTLTGS